MTHIVGYKVQIKGLDKLQNLLKFVVFKSICDPLPNKKNIFY